MALTLNEIQQQLGAIKFDTLLGLDVIRLATLYARTRYFEIENIITNNRISKLQAGSTITEQMLLLALGAVGGTIASVVAKKIIGKLLANHLVFVKTFVRVARKEDGIKVQKFLKLSDNVRIKDIAIDQFLNSDSVYGRIYSKVPEFVGSKFKDVIKGKITVKDPIWQKKDNIGDYLLKIEAWQALQVRTLELEFDALDNLLEVGKITEVEVILGEYAEFMKKNRFDTTTTAVQVAQNAQSLGDTFVIELFRRRYGIKKLKESKDILNVLVENLIHTGSTSPPLTYYQYDLSRSGMKKNIWKNPRVVRAVHKTAGDTLLGQMFRMEKKLHSSKIPRHLL